MNLTNSSRDGSSDGFVAVWVYRGGRDRQVTRTALHFDEKSVVALDGSTSVLIIGSTSAYARKRRPVSCNACFNIPEILLEYIYTS